MNEYFFYVINVEVSVDADTYIHRISCTGRISQEYSTTFIEGGESLLAEIAAIRGKIMKSVFSQSMNDNVAAPTFGHSQNYDNPPVLADPPVWSSCTFCCRCCSC
uniref:Uncharacterized protein n=1 Tax=Panagrolaimus sp. ES5 TaxID=591445 RepID=A0AC34FJY8_9BILA